MSHLLPLPRPNIYKLLQNFTGMKRNLENQLPFLLLTTVSLRLNSLKCV